MKMTILKFCLSAIGIVGFMAMKDLAPATISGKITPADAADAVWLIRETDTVKATVSEEGKFQAEVKAGTWQLVVSAKAPYRNAGIKEVVVTDDSNTDVGEIKLEQ